MIRRLGLVYPRLRYPSGDIPTGIALTAAVARRRLGLRVAVCDTTFDRRPGAVGEFLDRFRPDAVGIGLTTLMLDDARAAVAAAARRGIPAFVGGPHPTVAPAEMVAEPGVAACLVGEAEPALEDLLAGIDGGRRPPGVPGVWFRGPAGEVVEGAPPQRVEDLDALPWPAWELLPMERYLAAWGKLDVVRPGLRGVNVAATRGCPFDCAFCQPALRRLFGRAYRARSPAAVVDEIVELRRRYGVRGVWFTDDTLTASRAWVEELCDALRRRCAGLVWGCTTRAELVDAALLRVMAGAGLRRLGLGVESATEHVRERIYRKGVPLDRVEDASRRAHELGISVLLFLMLGAPGETARQMWRTVEFAAALPADEVSISLFVPLPGTHLHRQLRRRGMDLSDRAADYDYYARQPFTGAVSPRRLRLIQRAAYARFYGSPGRAAAVARTLRSAGGRAALGGYLRRLAPSRARRS